MPLPDFRGHPYVPPRFDPEQVARARAQLAEAEAKAEAEALRREGNAVRPE
jgi:hypothetical protein